MAMAPSIVSGAILIMLTPTVAIIQGTGTVTMQGFITTTTPMAEAGQ